MNELLLKAGFLLIAAIGVMMMMSDFSKTKINNSNNRKFIRF